MAEKGFSAFLKAASLLEPRHQIVLCYIPGHSLGESYSSAVKQLGYSTAPADWSMELWEVCSNLFVDITSWSTPNRRGSACWGILQPQPTGPWNSGKCAATSSLTFPPGLLRTGEIVPVRLISLNQINLFEMI